MSREVPDYLQNKEDSDMLASRIRAWWHKRGVYPHVWSEKQTYARIMGTDRSVWVVRSSLQLAVPKDIFAV